MIIDGKEISTRLLDELKAKVGHDSIVPGLGVVLVGDDPGSHIYVRNKIKVLEKLGFNYSRHDFEDISEDALLSLIDEMNADRRIHGILVQMPLPGHIDESKVISRISPNKDVDGFHPETIGRLVTGDERLAACTPKGVIKLIESTRETIRGKHAVIVGRSNNVGKPTALMLLNRNATVTICHSKTYDLARHTREADILVAAVGKLGIIKGDMVKKGAIVIDVGINRTEKGLCGDVDYEEVRNVAKHITPVPGGVGPMTIAMLMENLYACARGLKG